MTEADLFPRELETERLGLELIDGETLGPFEHYEAFADDPDPEEVFEYVPLEEPATPEDSRSLLAKATEGLAQGTAATYTIRPRDGEPDAGVLAGTTTMFVDWDCHRAEFAIVLRKPFWGRGYSGERASAFVDLAFDRLDLDCVTVSCIDGNERSRRAIEKYVDGHGGEYDGLFRNLRTIGEEPSDLHRYSIIAPDHDGDQATDRGDDPATDTS